MSAWKTLTILLLGLSVFSCARTPETRFYLLAGPEPVNLAKSPDFIIAIEPLVLPEYLERPQIIVHQGNQQISMAEFDRWAEPLRDNIAQVLAESLTAEVADQGGRGVFRQPRLMPADYRVHLVIEHFDVYPGLVELRCHWVMVNAEQGKVHSRGYFSAQKTYSKQAEQQGMNEAVVASGLLIRQLAGAIVRDSGRL